ncbi:hypothetical protein [Castellaniella sp. GW247-6E4]|uniref:hypothetical protein n=1 Tax=Castellaniella sp. GW247-6E4 TaxID=3140380 RepID=UPI00331581BA
MISARNQPYRTTAADSDFTENNYLQLLRLAKESYLFSTYRAIPWGTRFILWRHDLDYSISRALALAEIEAGEGVCATYFINPRSEFYNPFEPGPARLIKRIVGNGHHLGLHFDAKFYDIQSEEQLDEKVAVEAQWLTDAFDVELDAFSFHNPVEAHLECHAERYGGLVNCYSRELQTQVPYCSDSNGYWRFRRLYDVLHDAIDPCLQVLTHPGWWQKESLEPRRRIFRCVYGRAQATMKQYDLVLAEAGRVNHGRSIESLNFLESAHGDIFTFFDYLWNKRQFSTLFFELWRIHRLQITQLCRMILLSIWKIAAVQVDRLFNDDQLNVKSGIVAEAVLGPGWRELSGMTEAREETYLTLLNDLTNGRALISESALENECASICKVISTLSEWGQSQPIAYDGIKALAVDGECLDAKAVARCGELWGMDRENDAEQWRKRWEELVAVLASKGFHGVER